jgi:hypothetical protein
MRPCLKLLAPLALGLLSASIVIAADVGTGAPPAPTEVPAATPIGSGPYRAIMEVDPSLATHTIYHPADLSQAGQLPIVVWGNGGCVNQGNRFRWFLSEIASYGYLVIALGPIVDGLQSWPTSMAPVEPHVATAAEASRLPPPATHSSQLIDAISWAVAQNERSDGRFGHRLNTARIAVMGQSCGGTQAIEASADPRVTTTVIWNSGLFLPGTGMGGGKFLTREDLNLLHGPTAYISGDDEDIAFVNANGDFDYLQKLPVLRAWGRGILHSGTYSERNGGEFGAIAVAWLNWQLKGNARASRLFLGTDCGLCLNPRWVVHSKNLH